jgi:hypothetical protein
MQVMLSESNLYVVSLHTRKEGRNKGRKEGRKEAGFGVCLGGPGYLK